MPWFENKKILICFSQRRREYRSGSERHCEEQKESVDLKYVMRRSNLLLQIPLLFQEIASSPVASGKAAVLAMTYKMLKCPGSYRVQNVHVFDATIGDSSNADDFIKIISS